MGLICGSRWPPPTPAERGLTGYRAGGFRPGVTMHRGDAVAAEFDIAIIHAAEAKGWRERGREATTSGGARQRLSLFDPFSSSEVAVTKRAPNVNGLGTAPTLRPGR